MVVWGGVGVEEVMGMGFVYCCCDKLVGCGCWIDECC